MTKSRGIRRPKGQRDAWAAAHAGLHRCACGCGTAIAVRPEHIHDGVPSYIHGHNRRGKTKPLPPRNLCECGCGSLAGPGKRFISGHNGRGKPRLPETIRKMSEAQRGEKSHRYGVKPPNFVGRVVSTSGYVMLHEPDHPFASSKKLVMEHRLVMEAHLRSVAPDSPHLIEVAGTLYLRKSSDVHHRNEVKDDNRIENLEVMTKAEHARHHEGWKKANEVRAAKRAQRQ